MTPLDPMLQKELALWRRVFAGMPNPALAPKLALTLLEIFIEGERTKREARESR